MQESTFQYPNPPVREATCEFRFQPGPEPWDLSFPGLVYNELRETFPRRIHTDLPQQVFSITMGNPHPQLAGVNPVDPFQSLQFWKSDRQDGVITVAQNRIAVSHYRPYPSWAVLRDIINQAYGAYVKVAEPQSIQRIGLRYINEIDFASPAVSLSEYFTYHPNLGPDLPKFNQNVKMSVDFVDDKHQDVVRLQLATGTGANPDSIAVVLDIDYFLLLPGAISLTSTEEWLDQAHSVINSVFEGSITDRARTMFGWRSQQ